MKILTSNTNSLLLLDRVLLHVCSEKLHENTLEVSHCGVLKLKLHELDASEDTDHHVTSQPQQSETSTQSK